jgi:hypothetical protein
MSKSEPIINTEFVQMTRCLVGLPISRPWQGYGTALFTEVGPLTRTYKRTGHAKADFGLDFGHCWRVEGQRSILFGSSSGRQKIHNGIESLTGLKIIDVTTPGRLPELCVQLSDGRWIHSFATSEGRPEWSVFLNDGSWLTVKRNRIRKMSQRDYDLMA